MELIKKAEHRTYCRPVIIHGEAGCGKTAVMAKIAQESLTWFNHTPVRIIRFLGTSPGASSIKKTYITIIRQIWENYGHKPSALITYNQDFSFLRLYFEALLTKIDTEEKPLVMILDSVDQLSESDYAFEMKWLPLELPPNVHLIISMHNNAHDVLYNTRRILRDPDAFVEVDYMSKEIGRKVLEGMMDGASRRFVPLFIFN